MVEMIDVIIDGEAYEVETRKKTFILRAPRSVLYSVRKGEIILCDACNTELSAERINLLVDAGYSWGMVCDKCRQKYHSKSPKYTLKSPKE